MFRNHRCWAITQADSAEELATKLTEHKWTSCTGFEHSGYLFLNDAASADGAQEYAIINEDPGDGTPRQIESVTFSWMNEGKVLSYIRDVIAGKDDRSAFAHPVPVSWEPIEQHGRCQLCA